MDDRKRKALTVYREMLSELMRDCEEALEDGGEDEFARGLAQVYNSHMNSLQRIIGEYVSGFEDIDVDDASDADAAIRLIKLQTKQLLAAMRAAEALDEPGDTTGLKMIVVPNKKGAQTVVSTMLPKGYQLVSVNTQANAGQQDIDSGDTAAILDILHRVEKGEITPDEAARRIDAVKGKTSDGEPGVQTGEDMVDDGDSDL